MSAQDWTRRKICTASVIFAASAKSSYGANGNSVYNNWTQNELDNQINQTSYLPTDTQEIIDNYAKNSNLVRSRIPPKTFAYGDSPNETLDVFAPNGAKDLPAMVFIHGGAWKEWSKDDFSFAAPIFVSANAVYIVIGFDNIPPNTIGGIIEQCRNALGWINNHADQLGIDRKRIFVSGHSSGGHLANMMLATQWKKRDLPDDLIKGGVVLSGWTDLYPISLSNRKSYIKVTGAQIKNYSPIDQIKNIRCPVVVAWGSLESPYMQTQSAMWASKLQERSQLAGAYKIMGCNHLEMANQFGNANSQISKAALALMALV